jgi:hypothetical protein
VFYQNTYVNEFNKFYLFKGIEINQLNIETKKIVVKNNEKDKVISSHVKRRYYAIK